jgi:nitroreductase
MGDLANDHTGFVAGVAVGAVAVAAGVCIANAAARHGFAFAAKRGRENKGDTQHTPSEEQSRRPRGAKHGVLECIRNRRSVFPRSYAVNREVTKEHMELILDAAMWAPFHGSKPPWRFVVLGKESMREMQELTLQFYDREWRTCGFPGGDGSADTSTDVDTIDAKREQNFKKWRAMTEEEITGRWGPVSFMVAIVMRRQAGSKRMPEWEEICATACAVENMHIQACSSETHGSLACYWSSWHSEARDSEDMREYLGMGEEDKCLGFFMVAGCDPGLKDDRKRSRETHLAVEWRE